MCCSPSNSSYQICGLQDHHAHYTLSSTHHCPTLSSCTWVQPSGSLPVGLPTPKYSLPFESYLKCPLDFSNQWGNRKLFSNYCDNWLSKLSQYLKNYLPHTIYFKVIFLILYILKLYMDWRTKCYAYKYTLWKCHKKKRENIVLIWR